jgi:hypothetical protein
MTKIVKALVRCNECGIAEEETRGWVTYSVERDGEKVFMDLCPSCGPALQEWWDIGDHEVTKPVPKPNTEGKFICSTCGYQAENLLGLSIHQARGSVYHGVVEMKNGKAHCALCDSYYTNWRSASIHGRRYHRS